MWRGSTITVNWDCLTVVGKNTAILEGVQGCRKLGSSSQEGWGGSNYKANFGNSTTVGLSPVNN